MNLLTRRRFLIATAAVCASTRLQAGTPLALWRGNALGAHAEVALAGMTQDEAAPVFRIIEAELSRIEQLFSLYRTDSALSRLNRDGVLDAPDPDFLHLMSIAEAVFTASEGAFDPTVQPLFAAHATASTTGRINPEIIREARSRIGFGMVSVNSAQIRFARDGMAMTLNGIAQGFASDKVAEALARQGLKRVVVNAGEIRAGDAVDGQGWPVRVPAGRMMRLTNRALATSELRGTLVNPRAGIGHIFDPRPKRAHLRSQPISALHDSAAMADAASTAAVVLRDDRLGLLARLGVEILPADARRL